MLQQNASYGLGQKLGLKRRIDNNAIVHTLAEAINGTHITIKFFSSYILQYTATVPRKTLLREHKIFRATTPLSYIERYVGKKSLDAYFRWFFFDLRVKSGNNVPIYVIVGFQNWNRIFNGTPNNDVFHKLQCFSCAMFYWNRTLSWNKCK